MTKKDTQPQAPTAPARDIRISATFRCAECNRPLLEVREHAGAAGFDLRCPTCDADLL